MGSEHTEAVSTETIRSFDSTFQQALTHIFGHHDREG